MCRLKGDEVTVKGHYFAAENEVFLFSKDAAPDYKGIFP